MSFDVSKYNKFVAALAGVVAIIAAATYDGKVDYQEAAGIASSAVAALAVFGVKNKQLDAVKKEADYVQTTGKL